MSNTEKLVAFLKQHDINYRLDVNPSDEKIKDIIVKIEQCTHGPRHWVEIAGVQRIQCKICGKTLQKEE